MKRHLALISLTLMFSFACGGGQQKGPSDSRALSVSDLYPMSVGNAWNYNIDTGAGLPPTLANVRVVSRNDASIVVETAGKARRYLLLPDGIQFEGSEEWLLKEPIEVGTSWTSQKGKSARIESVSKSVVVSGKTLTNCVAVTEVNNEGTIRVETDYCPGVGPVAIVVSAKASLTGKSVTTPSVLLGCALRPSAVAQKAGVCMEVEARSQDSVEVEKPR